MLKALTTVTNLVFLAGTITMLVLTILSGLLSKLPMNKFYWFKADTSGIPGAYNETVWTFWGACQAGDYTKCIYKPAMSINPAANFNTITGVPQPFIDDSDTYYYLSRFAFTSAFIALGFSAFALIVELLGIFWEQSKHAVVFLTSIATLFLAGLCALQTAVVILARNSFREAGLLASVQTISMAIIWTSLVTLLIVWGCSISGLIVSSYMNHMSNSVMEPGAIPQHDGSSFVRAPKGNAKGGGIHFFKVKRNAKDLDDESV